MDNDMLDSFVELQQKRKELLLRQEQGLFVYQNLLQEVGKAKARIDQHPQVRAVLEYLQRSEHERAVGAYERLLSAFLTDVLPGERQVVMDLKTEKGLSSLDVFIKKGVNAPLEDALHGTGGSVSNVLSAGLRMISLIRSGKRKFLVLDEADCWIKPSLIPAFASVIQQMAEDLNVQVLMISHHDEKLFEKIGSKVELRHAAGGVVIESGTPPEWGEGVDGIRSIYLEDVQSHSRTFLPLSPGVTFLHGENDSGKSAIVTALRGVFYGESNDTMIRHGRSFCRVTIDLGENKAILWERRLKGTPKIIYKMIDSTHSLENPLHFFEGARTIPDWLPNETGVGLIESLDVQLGHQKDPIFLLNKPSSMRAKALAIGGESGHVQEMLALDRDDLQGAKLTLKHGESMLETQHRIQEILRPLVDTQDSFEVLRNLYEKRNALQKKMRSLQELHDRWSLLESKAKILSPIAHTVIPNLEISLSSNQSSKLLSSWKNLLRTKKILMPIASPWLITPPDTPKALEATTLADRWAKSQKKQAILAAHLKNKSAIMTPKLFAPEVEETKRQWNALHQTRIQLIADVELLEQEEANLAARIVSEFKQCPVCNQDWDAHPGETIHA